MQHIYPKSLIRVPQSVQLCLHISEPLLKILVSGSTAADTAACNDLSVCQLSASSLVCLRGLYSFQPISKRLIWYAPSIRASIKLSLRANLLHATNFLWARFLANCACFSRIISTLWAIVGVLLLVCKLILETILEAATRCVEQIALAWCRGGGVPHGIRQRIRPGQRIPPCQATPIILINLSPFIWQISIHFRNGGVEGILGGLIIVESRDWLGDDTGPLIGQPRHLALKGIVLVHGIV